jgi:hypothetical protein
MGENIGGKSGIWNGEITQITQSKRIKRMKRMKRGIFSGGKSACPFPLG